MGKALLLIVLGSGLVFSTQLLSSTQTEAETAEDQNEYREEVIAREIAQSAFNVGMGVVRSHGDRLQAGARDLNGASGDGRSGTYTEGRFAGGEYTVRAHITSGHSVRVTATGRFGGAEHTVSDGHKDHRQPVLVASSAGIVRVTFLESMAGYCSAIFYEAYTPDMAPGTVPTPVMLFAPDTKRLADKRYDSEITRAINVEEGTQMNFFIGVNKNCPPIASSTDVCEVRKYTRDYSFDPSKFDHIHRALEVEAGSINQAEEAIWAFVEQSPLDRQTWRIAWEDLHHTDWDQPGSEDPEQSLQALKAFGYGGSGWVAPSDDDYVTLRDYWIRSGKSNNGHWTSYRPDFSDQVIEVELVSAVDPADAAEFSELHGAMTARQKECGESIEQPIARVEDEDLGETPQEVQEVKDAAADDGVDLTPDPADVPATTIPDDELTEYACDCTKDGTRAKEKFPILHRPPGNESNEQLLCLPQEAIVNGHMENHNDLRLSCNERRRVQEKNKDNKNK